VEVGSFTWFVEGSIELVREGDPAFAGSKKAGLVEILRRYVADSWNVLDRPS
jgi:hypothetical protein